ncbi:CGP-CTERM sorting domain-containing protein [Thermococcus aciditolerans]|uniref:CGP-CTERM sorting domain-containing protein n=1 Tax=Thermococcus aciditolerans TaxID=2598455 RepID=A0A5C0SJN4_9EURY|nr:CGP-CTERM sorting domain-containing protein [Thermococcus aciditolerans]QEK14501.1 CGP-CTERM sorting domain-containing protein [Thermococcus aciditolerans]
MSRLVIPLFIALLFLATPVSAVYYVNSGGFLYEVQYSVFSNGTNALIHAEVDNYGITCGMMENCWAEVYDVYDYLLFFDGSQLYLLNFTPALLSGLPPYAPKNVSSVYFKGITYVNGSWYVNVGVFAYSAEAQSGVNVDYVYRLKTKKFCVERVNASWSQLEKRVFKNEINGWRIEVPRNFFLVANASDTTWSPLLPLVVNWTQFPVYFTLKKGNLTRNVTLFYINTTNVINGFWFPNNVKIVNVTVCKTSANTSTSTAAETSTTPNKTITPPNTTKTPTNTKETKKGICGPGLISLLAVIPLILRRR